MDSKKIRIILIIFIVINIIALFTIISVINNSNREKENQNLAQNVTDATETTSDGKEVEGFKNVSVLYQNYKGYIPKSEIAGKIEKVVDQYFPIIYKHMIENKESREEYFNKYKASIKNRFGITESNDFNKLVEEIGKINCDISDYISYELLEDSFEIEGNYTKAKLIYTYSNGQKIQLDLYILNDESDTELEYKFIPEN